MLKKLLSSVDNNISIAKWFQLSDLSIRTFQFDLTECTVYINAGKIDCTNNLNRHSILFSISELKIIFGENIETIQIVTRTSMKLMIVDDSFITKQFVAILFDVTKQ